MERSSASLEEEACNHKEHTDAVDCHTAFEHVTAEMRRARCTVNQCNTVEEDGTENSTRDEILEHAFVSVHVLTADAHESVNREAREFHRNEQGNKVDSLGHEHCTASGKHHEAISFTALELFTAKSPLKARNAEETAKEDCSAKHAANRVHRVKVQESFGLCVVQSGYAKSNEESSHPRKNLVLVFVAQERFSSESHHAAQDHEDHRQEKNKIT